PDIEGWRVLERMKNDIATRHVPVCVISTEEARERAWRGGAWAFLAKPIQSVDRIGALVDAVKEVVQRKVTDVLLLAPKDTVLAKSLKTFDGALRLKHLTGAKAAVKALAKGDVGCFVCSAASIDPVDFPEQVAEDLAEGRLTMIV